MTQKTALIFKCGGEVLTSGDMVVSVVIHAVTGIVLLVVKLSETLLLEVMVMKSFVAMVVCHILDG